MTHAQAFTAAMRHQRRRDLMTIRRGLLPPLLHHFDAWLMWGWAIEPGGKSLGVAGETYPYWTEPRWLR